MGDMQYITYSPRADATPESELTALAGVYAYLLKTREGKKAVGPAPESDSRDGTKDSNGCIAYSHYNG
jgi:hypothetical protein